MKRLATSIEAWFPWLVLAAFLLYFFNPLRFDFAFPQWDVLGGGDSILHAVVIKTMIETGWVFQNPRLGAPFGTNLLDFPGADLAHLALLKFFTLFTSDATVVMNLFYVSSFALVYAAAYWAMRRFGISRAWASAGALLYTGLPYHYLRGTNHLYLSSYFISPLMTWYALRVYLGEPLAGQAQPGLRRSHVPLLLLAGSCGVYYAFFGIMVVVGAGALGSVERRCWKPIRHAVLATCIVVAGVLTNLAPNLIHRWTEGANPEVATRSAIETEIYGLRASQLLLPIWGHQNGRAAEFARRYHDALTPVTEAPSSALGVVGSCGFLFLLGVAFFGRTVVRDPRVHVLAQLNLLMFCFAVVGGLAVVFALMVTPQFRATNRVSVYIAFVSLLALFLYFRSGPGWLGSARARLQGRWPAIGRLFGVPGAAHVAALLVMLLALYDQVPLGARMATGSSNLGVFKQLSPVAGGPRPADAARKSIEDYRGFIRRIEASAGPGGMVYVLPYLPFPESPPAHEEGYNALLRPYYYSETLRWSYGAMKGRAGDRWLRALESLPMPQRVDALQKSGFSGIYVERKGLKDSAAGLEGQLRAVLGPPAIESVDSSAVFYALVPARPARITPAVQLAFGSGFYAEERAADSSWIWASRHGTLMLLNFSDGPMPVRFRAEISSLVPREWRMRAGSELLAEGQLQPGQRQQIDVRVQVPPGGLRVRLDSPQSEVRVPSDPRSLAMMLSSPTASAD